MHLVESLVEQKIQRMKLAENAIWSQTEIILSVHEIPTRERQNPGFNPKGKKQILTGKKCRKVDQSRQQATRPGVLKICGQIEG
jgi:hypothetical protein